MQQSTAECSKVHSGDSEAGSAREEDVVCTENIVLCVLHQSAAKCSKEQQSAAKWNWRPEVQGRRILQQRVVDDLGSAAGVRRRLPVARQGELEGSTFPATPQ